MRLAFKNKNLWFLGLSANGSLEWECAPLLNPSPSQNIQFGVSGLLPDRGPHRGSLTGVWSSTSLWPLSHSKRTPGYSDLDPLANFRDPTFPAPTPTHHVGSTCPRLLLLPGGTLGHPAHCFIMSAPRTEP